MNNNTEIRYQLEISPLRFSPELAESIIVGLKWTLGAMFEDPFPVRDVVVAVREIVDNIVTHADWDQTPAPSLVVSYQLHKGQPTIHVSSTNVVKDIEEAKRALDFIRKHVSSKTSNVLWHELTNHLIDSTDIRSNGGIGLLQVASSPRCRLDVSMDGSLFCVRVEVDMPDVHATAILPDRTGS
jgi:anti-sigma regulatory factor (Ser/Thr protein kinase)